MIGTWIQAGVAPLLALGLVWRGSRQVRPDLLSRWQARFAVAVEGDELEYVRRRLRRDRAVRAAGAGVGIAIGGLPSYMNLIDASRAADFANPLVGNAWLYGAILGALAAELLVLRRPTARAASLVPRRAKDYVSLRWTRVVGGAVALTAVAAVAEVVRRDWRWWYSLVGLAGALLAAAALTTGLRAIVHRPALAANGRLQEIDDAFRAYGAHHLMGASVALCGVSTSVALEPLLTETGPLAVVGAFLSLWTILLWMTLARETRWSVSRARLSV